jgi:Na+/melibiose symporter-like transporter
MLASGRGADSMKPVKAAIITFVLASIAGFLMIAFGYVGYADQANELDREGATGMAVVFFYAPLGGVIIGAVSAFLTFKLVSRRTG